MWTATKEFNFEAGHLLDGHPGKCKNLHGHNYRVLVEMSSEFLDDMEMVRDFYDIKKFTDPFFNEFDHAFIFNTNTRDPFELELYRLCLEYNKKVREFPYRVTAENMARYFYIDLNTKLIQQLDETKDQHNVWISKVTVYETPTSFATYSRKDKPND